MVEYRLQRMMLQRGFGTAVQYLKHVTSINKHTRTVMMIQVVMRRITGEMRTCKLGRQCITVTTGNVSAGVSVMTQIMEHTTSHVNV